MQFDIIFFNLVADPWRWKESWAKWSIDPCLPFHQGHCTKSDGMESLLWRKIELFSILNILASYFSRSIIGTNNYSIIFFSASAELWGTLFLDYSRRWNTSWNQSESTKEVACSWWRIFQGIALPPAGAERKILLYIFLLVCY